MSNKKVIPFFVLIIAGLIAVFTILWFGMKNEKKNIINAEGFESEEEYIKFEELFRENEADMKDFIELSQESILGEKEYYMLFDEDWYSSVLSGNLLRECILILYDNNTFVMEGNEEIKEELNKNDELMKTLDTIKEKEVIISISLYYLDSSIQMTAFTVDTKFTPFITSNNGVSNYFVYCNDEGCEKYGYKNIEGNWYMRISPAPE